MARTAISMGLFLHLFALTVAFASNTSPMIIENQRLRPDVKRQLRQVPLVTPYLRVLNMDTGFGAGNEYRGDDFHLTHGMQWDTDHTVEVDLTLADGSTKSYVLPEPDLEPRLRRRRLQNLTVRTARLATTGNEVVEGRLPRAIAAHLVARAQAETGQTVTGGWIVCRSHLLQDTLAPESSDDAVRDPFSDQYYRDVIAYNILVTNGLVELLKDESRADSAPSTAPQ